MRLAICIYLFILYLSVAQTLLNHFKRHIITMNECDDSALVVASKIVAWTWPLYIPISYLCQFLYPPDVEKLCQDLDEKPKK